MATAGEQSAGAVQEPPLPLEIHANDDDKHKQEPSERFLSVRNNANMSLSSSPLSELSPVIRSLASSPASQPPDSGEQPQDPQTAKSASESQAPSHADAPAVRETPARNNSSQPVSLASQPSRRQEQDEQEKPSEQPSQKQSAAPLPQKQPAPIPTNISSLPRFKIDQQQSKSPLRNTQPSNAPSRKRSRSLSGSDSSHENDVQHKQDAPSSDDDQPIQISSSSSFSKPSVLSTQNIPMRQRTSSSSSISTNSSISSQKNMVVHRRRRGRPPGRKSGRQSAETDDADQDDEDDDDQDNAPPRTLGRRGRPRRNGARSSTASSAANAATGSPDSSNTPSLSGQSSRRQKKLKEWERVQAERYLELQRSVEAANRDRQDLKSAQSKSKNASSRTNSGPRTSGPRSHPHQLSVTTNTQARNANAVPSSYSPSDAILSAYGAKRSSITTDSGTATPCDTEETTIQLPDRKKPIPASTVNTLDRSGRTIIFKYSSRGDISTVAALLRAGADLSIADYAGWTPLHEACLEGHAKIVELMLAYGAQVDIPGGDGDTPLHDAVGNGHVEVVDILLRHGASITAINERGQTPLEFAQQRAQDASEAYEQERQELLNQDDPDASPPPRDRETSVMDTDASHNPSASKDAHPDGGEHVEGGVSGISTNSNNSKSTSSTAASNASKQSGKIHHRHHTYRRKSNALPSTEQLEKLDGERRSASMIVSILETWQDMASRITQRDVDGQTLLHRACSDGDVNRVTELLIYGADIQASDVCGWTPLHDACLGGHVDCVAKLLSYGANVNASGGLLNPSVFQFRETAMPDHEYQSDSALTKETLKVTLRRTGVGETPLHDAASNGHVHVVKLLLEYGADSNRQNVKGQTPLDLVRETVKRIQVYLSKPADADCSNHDEDIVMRSVDQPDIKSELQKDTNNNKQKDTTNPVSDAKPIVNQSTDKLDANDASSFLSRLEQIVELLTRPPESWIPYKTPDFIPRVIESSVEPISGVPITHTMSSIPMQKQNSNTTVRRNSISGGETSRGARSSSTNSGGDGALQSSTQHQTISRRFLAGLPPSSEAASYRFAWGGLDPREGPFASVREEKKFMMLWKSIAKAEGNSSSSMDLNGQSDTNGAGDVPLHRSNSGHRGRHRSISSTRNASDSSSTHRRRHKHHHKHADESNTALTSSSSSASNPSNPQTHRGRQQHRGQRHQSDTESRDGDDGMMSSSTTGGRASASHDRNASRTESGSRRRQSSQRSMQVVSSTDEDDDMEIDVDGKSDASGSGSARGNSRRHATDSAQRLRSNISNRDNGRVSAASSRLKTAKQASNSALDMTGKPPLLPQSSASSISSAQSAIKRKNTAGATTTKNDKNQAIGRRQVVSGSNLSSSSPMSTGNTSSTDASTKRQRVSDATKIPTHESSRNNKNKPKQESGVGSNSGQKRVSMGDNGLDDQQLRHKKKRRAVMSGYERADMNTSSSTVSSTGRPSMSNSLGLETDFTPNETGGGRMDAKLAALLFGDDDEDAQPSRSSKKESEAMDVDVVGLDAPFVAVNTSVSVTDDTKSGSVSRPKQEPTQLPRLKKKKKSWLGISGYQRAGVDGESMEDVAPPVAVAAVAGNAEQVVSGDGLSMQRTNSQTDSARAASVADADALRSAQTTSIDSLRNSADGSGGLSADRKQVDLHSAGNAASVSSGRIASTLAVGKPAPSKPRTKSADGKTAGKRPFVPKPDPAREQAVRSVCTMFCLPLFLVDSRIPLPPAISGQISTKTSPSKSQSTSSQLYMIDLQVALFLGLRSGRALLDRYPNLQRRVATMAEKQMLESSPVSELILSCMAASNPSSVRWIKTVDRPNGARGIKLTDIDIHLLNVESVVRVTNAMDRFGVVFETAGLAGPPASGSTQAPPSTASASVNAFDAHIDTQLVAAEMVVAADGVRIQPRMAPLPSESASDQTDADEKNSFRSQYVHKLKRLSGT